MAEKGLLGTSVFHVGRKGEPAAEAEGSRGGGKPGGDTSWRWNRCLGFDEAGGGAEVGKDQGGTGTLALAPFQSVLGLMDVRKHQANLRSGRSWHEDSVMHETWRHLERKRGASLGCLLPQGLSLGSWLSFRGVVIQNVRYAATGLFLLQV